MEKENVFGIHPVLVTALSVEGELRPSAPVFYMGITRPRVYVRW